MNRRTFGKKGIARSSASTISQKYRGKKVHKNTRKIVKLILVLIKWRALETGAFVLLMKNKRPPKKVLRALFTIATNGRLNSVVWTKWTCRALSAKKKVWKIFAKLNKSSGLCVLFFSSKANGNQNGNIKTKHVQFVGDAQVTQMWAKIRNFLRML